jgi:hypothetical protein
LRAISLVVAFCSSGSGDGAGDHLGNGTDGVQRALAVSLHAFDFAADIFGGLGGLFCQSLTSLATTANPLPASPARAASMVAFRASSLGLLRDGSDHLEHLTDFGAGITELGHGAIGLFGEFHWSPAVEVLSKLLAKQ